MEQWSTVMKSKSSNNGVPLKPTKNKKSISDGDFTPNLVKKRGVYVDRNAFNSQEANDYRTNRKPPPRPRPGQKKFLASVLTILSKSTTGTQYPDTDERTDKKNTKAKTRCRLRHETDTKTEKSYKQGKYKSRVLSKNTNDDDDQFIILQSTKQIAQTPSNYSDATAIVDVQEEKTKIRSIRDVLVNNPYNVAVDEVRNVLEDKTNKKDKKIRIKDEPDTLASEMKEEGDKKMYNLFVDLLESTFNAYSLKDGMISDSNTTLEINESVAKKLTINNKELNYVTNDINKSSTVKDKTGYFNNQTTKKLSNDKPPNHIKRRVSMKSCDYQKANIPEVYSFPNKRKYTKSNKKSNLLNIFKEELQSQPTCEEPVNLYQALKVMAKNKHKKNIHLENIPTENSLDKKCVLKRRKIISMKSKKTDKIINRDIIGQKYSELNSRIKKKEKNNRVTSNHSLKVIGYNYEDVMEKLYRTPGYAKLTAVPSPFKMQYKLDYSTLLKFPDRSSYDFTY